MAPSFCERNQRRKKEPYLCWALARATPFHECTSLKAQDTHAWWAGDWGTNRKYSSVPPTHFRQASEPSLWRIYGTNAIGAAFISWGGNCEASAKVSCDVITFSSRAVPSPPLLPLDPPRPWSLGKATRFLTGLSDALSRRNLAGGKVTGKK